MRMTAMVRDARGIVIPRASFEAVVRWVVDEEEEEEEDREVGPVEFIVSGAMTVDVEVVRASSMTVRNERAGLVGVACVENGVMVGMVSKVVDIL